MEFRIIILTSAPRFRQRFILFDKIYWMKMAYLSSAVLMRGYSLSTQLKLSDCSEKSEQQETARTEATRLALVNRQISAIETNIFVELGRETNITKMHIKHKIIRPDRAK